MPRFIEDEMRNEYLKSILKKHDVNYSGLKRDELLNSFYSLVQNEKITSDKFWDIVANVFKYGNNRIIISNLVSIHPSAKYLSRTGLEECLSKVNEPLGRYNILNEIDLESRFIKDTLVFQNILYDENEDPVNIDRCYCRTEQVTNSTDQEGNTITSTVRVFTWLKFDFLEKKLSVHTRTPNISNLQQSVALSKVNSNFIGILKKTFNFTVQNVIHEKTTLYNIYKEMTDTAERPFREKVNSFRNEFQTFYTSMNKKLDYNADSDDIKLLDRMIRLYERGLITQNEDLYSKYYDGKLGIIQRIVFCDKTGANVSAKTKELEENISNYDIYFDTRDTLDEKQTLDKLWALWYYVPEGKRKKKDYLVKFEVYNDYYITHFIGPFLTQEVADYVFSKFREFEN
ncbi:hypothetical protein [Enterococcus mundtii]|uniref:hypothetical protein n=1 Tax=Enterococcus mundtii TaxID=53346 RepID=UPI0013765DF2|nr:hypothetical protein [Enterococcus mundtii]NBA63080.1 hypothetical protein [Enterococcus mundtii]